MDKIYILEAFAIGYPEKELPVSLEKREWVAIGDKGLDKLKGILDDTSKLWESVYGEHDVSMCFYIWNTIESNGLILKDESIVKHFYNMDFKPEVLNEAK